MKRKKIEEEKVSTEESFMGESPKKVLVGRQNDYFFPNERVTIKASSIFEAYRKLKEEKQKDE